MSDVLKRVLCLVLALVVVFSFSACRHSPVLEQTVYTADGEVDPNNQQTDNDEEHSEDEYCIIGTDVKNGEILLYHSSDYEEVMKVQRDITRWLQSEAFSTFEMPTADEGGDA